MTSQRNIEDRIAGLEGEAPASPEEFELSDEDAEWVDGMLDELNQEGQQRVEDLDRELREAETAEEESELASRMWGVLCDPQYSGQGMY